MKKKLKFLALLLLLSLVLETGVASAGTVPYDTYNYDYWENIVLTPAAYIPAGSISGSTVGTTGFMNPQDISVGDDGRIYVADSGNNRIVVIAADHKSLDRVIEGVMIDGKLSKFNGPYGIYVTKENLIYIADTNNRRIVVLDDEDNLVDIIENPQSEVLAKDYAFMPLKVCVDYAGRVYSIIKGETLGIMQFEGHEFTGYFGTIEVGISLAEKFWRKIATKEEREKQIQYVPTEFTGLDIDEDGFIFATNRDTQGKQAVRRLNPKGDDVIRKGENQNVGGDIITSGTSDYSGASYIVDVAVRDKGIYSLLDNKRGRIFTYDSEGNLLYIFGGLGTQTGTFVTPVSIEADNRFIYVLDSFRKEILLFKVTEYGALINEAVGLRYDGDEKEAVDIWWKVLALDENNELANRGIGKAYLSAGDNEMAMKYLELGNSRQYYSIAFKRYRNELLKASLGYILTVLFVIIVGLVAFKQYKKRSVKKKG
ncbi:MAG: NHL repeat-containing protein [Lachnospiraceae bacterium]|nr:NHL repeat-containing protein [Lachnospiraceae bacterium]